MKKLNILIIFAIVTYTVTAPMFGLVALVAYSEKLQILIMTQTFIGSFMFMILCGSPLMALALIPSFGFAGIAGFIFEGTLTSYLCVTAGVFFATYLGIIFAKKVSKDAIGSILNQKPSWNYLYEKALGAEGASQYWFLFMLRISPHMPFALTNLLVSQSKISTFRLACISTLGLLPRSFLAVIVGSHLVLIREIFKFQGNAEEAILITAIITMILAFKIYKIKKGWSVKPMNIK